jgi:RNA polymerase sigma-70 factor (ECF subfamily)
MTPNEAPSISDLLARSRAHVPGEIDRLFGACRSYLHLQARAQVEKWLQAKVDASDLVQQTLLEAYRDFEQFRGSNEAEWLAWLRRILARNAAEYVRHYRGTQKRQARREVPLQTDSTSTGRGVQPAAAEETPSQALLHRERELLLAEALMQLSEDHREVICLRNLQRLAFDEVARRMERTRPAVQMLWMRAIHKLQELLAVLDSSAVGTRSSASSREI